jgi:hypothetical protein
MRTTTLPRGWDSHSPAGAGRGINIVNNIYIDGKNKMPAPERGRRFRRISHSVTPYIISAGRDKWSKRPKDRNRVKEWISRIDKTWNYVMQKTTDSILTNYQSVNSPWCVRFWNIFVAGVIWLLSTAKVVRSLKISTTNPGVKCLMRCISVARTGECKYDPDSGQ